MAQPDLVSVELVGDAVHPDYPEDAAVIAERLKLYPAGCLVLDGKQGIKGYAVALFFIVWGTTEIYTQLGRLPIPADTFYIHDLALLPEARDRGLGMKAVDLLAHQGKLAACTNLSLVAVGNSPHFWRKNGFQEMNEIALGSYENAVFMARVLA